MSMFQLSDFELFLVKSLPIFLIPLDKGRSDILIIKDKGSLKKYREQLGEWDGVDVLAEPSVTITDANNNDLHAKETKIENQRAVNSPLFIYPYQITSR